MLDLWLGYDRDQQRDPRFQIKSFVVRDCWPLSSAGYERSVARAESIIFWGNLQKFIAQRANTFAFREVRDIELSFNIEVRRVKDRLINNL